MSDLTTVSVRGPAAALLALLVLVAVGGSSARAAETPGGCPASQAAHPFVDAVGNTHEEAIGCVAARGVAKGVSPIAFAPARRVTRAQTAAFLARTLERAGADLPTATPQGFDDVGGSVHAERINQLAAAGVVNGTDEDTYEPHGVVRRDQMASFLIRAYRHVTGEEPSTGQGTFDDIDANTHEQSILQAASEGLVSGTDSATYAPALPVRRDQMAAFLARLLDALGPAQGVGSEGPDNVILLVGDGMGHAMVDTASAYEEATTRHQVRVDAEANRYERLDGPPRSVYEHFPSSFAVNTAPADGGYDPLTAWTNFAGMLTGPTDSAAAATAMATGQRTTNGRLAVTPGGEPLDSVADRARDAGKAVGTITSVPFNHATPAAFLVNHADRGDYHAIAAEMLDSGADVIMGAGHPHYDNDARPRPPQFDYLAEGDLARLRSGDTSYTYVESPEQFAALGQGQTPARVFGLARAGSTLQEGRSGPTGPFAAPRNDDVPSLADMAVAGLHVLDGASDQGFFAMVEGGAIDWAAHDHLTGRLVEEQLAFDAAVEAVTSWVAANSSWEETLVVVTSDHETGYLTGPGSNPTWQPIAPAGVEQLPAVSWHTSGHTNQLVPLFAKGRGQDRLWRYTEGADALRGPYLHLTGVAQLVIDAWDAG